MYVRADTTRDHNISASMPLESITTYDKLPVINRIGGGCVAGCCVTQAGRRGSQRGWVGFDHPADGDCQRKMMAALWLVSWQAVTPALLQPQPSHNPHHPYTS